MAARFDSNVFAIFRANLAHLKGGSHLTVKLVLFLGDFNVILGRGLHSPAEIRVDVPPIRIQVAEMSKIKHHWPRILLDVNLQSLSVAIQKRLT